MIDFSSVESLIFAKNYPQPKKSKDTIHLFEEIAYYAGICLDKEKDLESVFLLDKELMEDTIFSVYVNEKLGDIYADNLYLISKIGEDNQKSASQPFMFYLPE